MRVSIQRTGTFSEPWSSVLLGKILNLMSLESIVVILVKRTRVTIYLCTLQFSVTQSYDCNLRFYQSSFQCNLVKPLFFFSNIQPSTTLKGIQHFRHAECPRSPALYVFLSKMCSYVLQSTGHVYFKFYDEESTRYRLLGNIKYIPVFNIKAWIAVIHTYSSGQKIGTIFIPSKIQQRPKYTPLSYLQ